MNKIKVSVVMITYAHEKFIEQAINGILLQKCNFNVEILIANDHSPDQTDDKIQGLLKNIFPDNISINYILREKNWGMLPNFFDTLSKASGDYIALCEGDDYWIDSLKLQKQVDFLEKNTEIGLVATDFNILYEATNKIEKSLFKNKPDRFPIYTNFEQFLLAAGYMAPCTWLLRREYLPKFNEKYVDGTFPWLLDIFAKTKVHVLEDTTTVYRYLNESASHSKSLQKLYEVSKGVLQIQLDYVNLYQLDENFTLKVLKKHYSSILPIIVALGNKEEIRNASRYIPDIERSYKDKILLTISSMPLSKEIMKLALYYKNK
ncbi:glycosyltransferase [Chryseobacterium sp. 09-1422]|uniref:Glycosyltransferase n=1 Tax=Chryseobacterium kimseyorum TaxID=2984028 RepID=A0ABT3I3S9_9FLAO|nr:glycosyltransferase [Chryseobacterium kimseyorum]MCW3170513.1 glycosyltransferase [Chryseobacterium kimseyorum]